MSAARRSLYTATAAGTLLAALWFVPSATATPEKPAEADQQQTAVHTRSGAQLRLADTGSVDTTPYLIGGTAFLGIGVGFLTYSTRRSRTTY
ncbi:hypothetical protein [Streptomyces sp. NPDC046821]|uniref:hypothetical protein n=1 Tax=Streptomyces sp. NPDC046821 TaxID=3154702 RepID=UPI0034008EB3